MQKNSTRLNRASAGNREGKRVIRKTLTEITDQFQYWLKSRSAKWGAPVLKAPDDDGDESRRDRCRIQRQQLVLEAKFMFAGTQALLVAKACQRGPKQILEQCRGAVLIGVRQCGAAGSFGNTGMHQAAETTGQTVANLAEGIGASELAKQHGYELGPAAKSLGGMLSAMFLYQGGELATGKMLEQLIEQAGNLYDCLGPPCGRRSAKSRQGNICQRSIIGGPSIHAPQKFVLDNSDLGKQMGQLL
jgi:hypothetical protein